MNCVQNWVGCTRCTPNGPWLHARCTQAVRTAPRPHAHCALSWLAVCRVAAQHRPCCRPNTGRVVPYLAPARLCSGLSCDTPSRQAAHCIATHKAAPSRNKIFIATLPGQATLLSRYKRLYRDAPQWLSRSPVTIQLIVS